MDLIAACEILYEALSDAILISTNEPLSSMKQDKAAHILDKHVQLSHMSCASCICRAGGQRPLHKPTISYSLLVSLRHVNETAASDIQCTSGGGYFAKGEESVEEDTHSNH